MSRPTPSPDSHYRAPPLLVVTDLDGTLLDHNTYSFAAAGEALSRLRELGIPLIPNTSKTSAELGPLRQALGTNDPFVVENGSGIFLPRDRFPLPPGGKAWNSDYYLVELGLGYQDILARLAPLRERFSFRGFNDLSDAELEQLTGLQPQEVKLSRQRRFSEPLVWEDSATARQEFLQEIERLDLQTLQGGRFLHVLGRTDKGKALNRLRTLYEHCFGQPFEVIALGDSGNDVAMLEAADWPVLIRSPSHQLPRLGQDREVTVSRHNGPEGWNECVLNLVEQFMTRTGRI